MYIGSPKEELIQTYIYEENKIVHTRTVEARNYLLSILNEKGVCV